MENNLEDGELPSSPEPDDTPYNPLPRPENLNSNRIVSSSCSKEIENSAMLDEDSLPGPIHESDDDSDSDFEGNHRAKRQFQASKSGMDVDPNDHGAIFKQLAAKFQAGRQSKAESKRNNVWGSILQEDALTSEMTGIGVGRTAKDLPTDRGAEAYDYYLAGERFYNNLIEI